MASDGRLEVVANGEVILTVPMRLRLRQDLAPALGEWCPHCDLPSAVRVAFDVDAAEHGALVGEGECVLCMDCDWTDS